MLRRSVRPLLRAYCANGRDVAAPAAAAAAQQQQQQQQRLQLAAAARLAQHAGQEQQQQHEQQRQKHPAQHGPVLPPRRGEARFAANAAVGRALCTQGGASSCLAPPHVQWQQHWQQQQPWHQHQHQQQQRRAYTSDPTPATKEAVERTVVINTLDLARKFEASGLARDAAEKLTEHITATFVLDRLRLSEKFVARVDLDRLLSEQEARSAGFRAELVQKQEAHLATLHKDLERQQAFLDKMRAETRHEIDKLTSAQRLDLNLEKGRMRDDLQHMRDRATDLELKMDREINELKATVEKAKNDTIKTVIGILGTFSAVVFTVTRLITFS